MEIFLQADVIEIFALCALWFALGFLVAAVWGGLVRYGEGIFAVKNKGDRHV